MKSLLVSASLLGVVTFARAADDVQFNRDVRPILADNCFACHGFDAKTRKADLRLDTVDGAFAKRDGSPAITPGDLAKSEVWSRITSKDDEAVMPPPKSRKTLTDAQKATLRRWIESGAKYQQHWAFEAPVKPAAPATAVSPVDAFLLQRLAKDGLRFSPEADRPTLIRRVAFALTGLPPTVAEVDAFLADRSPDAYGRMVDRYLASPKFGEEMARHWLDVARYGDTHGLHLDNERTIWPYRDWVVRAFNENLSFDKFTRWQIAGDLLPNPSHDQLAATAFNRCNVTTSEGGAINEEFVYRYAVDRTSTVVQAWLGLTAGCAVCHDHKYDPLTMKEFYSLYAFFNSAADPAMDGNINVTAPFRKVPAADQAARLEAAKRKESDALKALEARAADFEANDPEEGKDGPTVRTTTVSIFDDFFPLGSTNRNTSRNAADWVADPALKIPAGRRALRQANGNFHEDAIQLVLTPVRIPERAVFEIWLRPDADNRPSSVSIQIGPGKKRVSWGGEGSRRNQKPAKGKAAASDPTVRGPMPTPGVWTKLTLSAEDFGVSAGQLLNSVTLQQTGGVAYWDSFTVTGERDPATDPLLSFPAWWKELAKKSPTDVPADVAAVLKAGPDGKHTPEQVEKLRRFYLGMVAEPASDTIAAARKVWLDAKAERIAIEDELPGTMIYRDADRRRESFLMLRGQYDKRGAKVEPGVPAVFPSLKPASDRPTRLDLADWLLTPENPLTARVAVNRFWQQLFGTGLVKTSYDFGTQGESPSHPELLDWLAVDFRESGWDVKRLIRMLVTSAAFQQQARVTPELLRKDRDNRLYARGPRFRLDAEQIRDNALFTGGLLNETMGGRGVNPYQPPNIWEPVGYADSNTRYFLQDHGESLYRRSLYVFLKRTAPPPFMANFDAPNREQLCTVRDRTNTPMQALQLMNDVQHFEAARGLAERVLRDGGATTADRVTYLYRVVLSRKPDGSEAAIVAAALDKQMALYRDNPDAATKAIHVGESKPTATAPAADLAAWTMVANLVLNLDETLNRN
ncbi:MAG: PSD1 and planctomycete cytochrome C domain-containing protein [Gemmataceae bacterium]